MQSKELTPDDYINSLTDDRKTVMSELRSVINKNLPEGFSEEMSYGMIGYVVPHSLYPAGYHCNPKLPLPLLNIASQKNYIALHHIGLYADKNLYDWFVSELSKNKDLKYEAGKGCIKFKKPEQMPFESIGKLAAKISVPDWIKKYENVIKKKS
ncbi:DUF1801 domain-containing protein [soil metagenome]